ncbi:hypothetical protein HDU91_004258 [Kappamyces sp. JEL0680]|nr:hypothetical protein HDU91_004258 [Kappamyces sp. JEL0680]
MSAVFTSLPYVVFGGVVHLILLVYTGLCYYSLIRSELRTGRLWFWLMLALLSASLGYQILLYNLYYVKYSLPLDRWNSVYGCLLVLFAFLVDLEVLSIYSVLSSSITPSRIRVIRWTGIVFYVALNFCDWYGVVLITAENKTDAELGSVLLLAMGLGTFVYANLAAIYDIVQVLSLSYLVFGMNRKAKSPRSNKTFIRMTLISLSLVALYLVAMAFIGIGAYYGVLMKIASEFSWMCFAMGNLIIPVHINTNCYLFQNLKLLALGDRVLHLPLKNRKNVTRPTVQTSIPPQATD